MLNILKKSYLLLFLAFLCSFYSFAQQATIKGSVVDTLEKRQLQHSSILLIRSKDSVLVKSLRANLKGEFQFENLKAGDYNLLISYPKMADYVRDIRLTDSSKFNLGAIPMESRVNLLNEVIIRAKKQAISLKGDTITYQADSFAVKPNANVQDLLRRLPGIEVDRNGAIKAGGKEVNTLLVDGEEFFGDDPLIASKYLKANAVREVQVYDKKTKEEELSGIRDGNAKEKIINIKLKENAKNGYLSTLDVNSDLNHFKNIGGMAGIYKGKLKAAVFGFNSNLNQNSKASEAMGELKADYDAVMVGDDGNIGIFSKRGDDDDNFSSTNGLPDIINYGAHFSNKWNENKLGLKLNYKGINNTVLDRNTSKSQFLLPNGTNFFDTGSSTSDERKTGQSLKGNVQVKLDSLSTLNISFAGSKNNSVGVNTSTSETKGGTGLFLNNNNQLSNSTANNSLYNGNINYSKKFVKNGRTLSIDLQPETKNGKGLNNNLNITNYYDANGVVNRTDNQNFLNDDSGSETSFATRVSYSEPLSKKFSLQTAYSFKTVTSNSYKLVFDKSLNNTRIDSLSNNFDFNNFSNIGKIVLQYQAKKFIFSGGAEATQTIFELNDLDRNNKFNRNYLNWAPKSHLQYQISKNTNFSLDYNGNTTQPSLDKLQPIRQINNPLYQIVGNPNLKPSFSNDITLDLMTFLNKSEANMIFHVTYGFTKNAIVNSSTIDNVNKRVSTFVNLNGTNNINAGVIINKHFSNIGFSSHLNIDYDLFNSVSILNNKLNKEVNNGFNLSPSFSYQNRKFQLDYSSKFTFSNRKSSIGSINNGKSFNHNHEISANVILPYDMEFNTSLSLLYQPANSSFKTPVDMALWNAYLSQKMLKSKELEVKLSVSDILAQKIGYNQYIGGNTISETTNSFIPRYVLIGLTYNLSGNFMTKDNK